MNDKTQTSFYSLLIFVSISLLSTHISAKDLLGQWQDVGVSLSGLARMKTPLDDATLSFVGVVDSKEKDEAKVVLIHLDDDYQASVSDPLPWPGKPPKDLESVAAIPNSGNGEDQQFVTTNSNGQFWRFNINNEGRLANVTLGSRKLLQVGDSNSTSAKEIESIGFYRYNNRTKILWAGRGSRDHPAYLLSADFINDSGNVSYEDSGEIRIQESSFNWLRPVWSKDEQSRLISDLKVASSPNGQLWVSSAFDGGDTGPFGGLLYQLGTFNGSTLTPQPQPLTPYTNGFLAGHGKKIEALELLGNRIEDGIIIGSDDEELGGFVMIFKKAG